MSTADDSIPQDARSEVPTSAAQRNPDTSDVPESTSPQQRSAVAVATTAVWAHARALPRHVPLSSRMFWAYLVVFGVVAALGWPLWQQHRLAAAQQAAQRAAVTYAQVLTSIDSDKVDDDFAAVLNGATGGFKDTYSKASVQLRQLLIDNKATAKGTVVQSAIQSGSQTTAVVLLMVNQSVTNTARPDPRVDRSRMKMTMEKVGGRWLASKVELP